MTDSNNAALTYHEIIAIMASNLWRPNAQLWGVVDGRHKVGEYDRENAVREAEELYAKAYKMLESVVT